MSCMYSCMYVTVESLGWPHIANANFSWVGQRRRLFSVVSIRACLLNVTMACSFHVITGSECGSHPRLPKHGNTVVPLETCNWDISSHLDVFRVTTSITSENSLILARVGIFEPMDFTICPAHRGKLGIHWKCRTKRCQVPNDIASHSSNKKQPPIGDRGVGFYQSKKIMESIRILVPVGSGM